VVGMYLLVRRPQARRLRAFDAGAGDFDTGLSHRPIGSVSGFSFRVESVLLYLLESQKIPRPFVAVTLQLTVGIAVLPFFIQHAMQCNVL